VSQIIEDMLEAYVAKKPIKWEQYLPLLEFIYKTFRHTQQDIVLLCWYMVFNNEPQSMSLFNKDDFNSTQNFLRDMQEMLHIERNSIKTTQDRARFYVDHNKNPHAFYPWQKVFLCVPQNSKFVSMGRYVKLGPPYCGPFIVLKHISSSAYYLDLLGGVVFHVVIWKNF
jgi:hypothetical protein